MAGRFIYTPAETATAAIEHTAFMKETAGAALFIPIDKVGSYVAPIRPGQMAGILGQSSHYKTGFIRFIERENAKVLRRKKEKGVLFHVSTEEDIEEMGSYELSVHAEESPYDLAVGKVKDWNNLMRKAISEMSTLPIFRIATSLHRDSGEYSDLYLSNILRELEFAIHQMGLVLAGVMVDYLQALPYDPEVRKEKVSDQRRLQVREDAYRLRDACKYFRAPFVVGLQAKQKLDGAVSSQIQIPGQYDIHESSDVTMRMDRIISIWLPHRTHPAGRTIKLGSLDLKVTEDMFFIRPVKQRGNLPAGAIFECSVDYYKNVINLAGEDLAL